VSTHPLLSVTGLRKSYGALEVLSDVSFDLAHGEKLAIIGPSGSGKSTCLRTLNCLEEPTAGEIRLAGKLIGRTASGRLMSPSELAPLRARIGMVFQHFHLWPHLTARQNVALQPRKVQGLSRRGADDLADAMLARVHLSAKADVYPGQLSGGQQQRVAIARALAQRPDLILFDEPTSALDPEMVNEVLTVIHEIADHGSAMVLVTHEIAFARNVADRILFMDGGQIIEQGPPTRLLDRPEEPRLQRFLSLVAPAVEIA
jgi:polar amino acid transport system ATP-binding protein